MKSFCIILLLFISCSEAPKKSVKAELYGVGNLSSELPEFMLTMNKNETKAYFNRMDKNRVNINLMFSTFENEQWTEAIYISLFEKPSRIVDPFLTNDEKYLFFSSNALQNEDDKKDDYNVWYVEIKDNQYSKPIYAEGINQPESAEIYTTLTNENIIAFSSEIRGDKKRDIYLSKFDGKIFTKPERVFIPGTRNQKLGNPGISPDGNTIVFGANLEVTVGGYDLYYTEKKKDGWSIAKNLGPLVNSEETEFTPVFSKNGEWLYFTSERAGVVQDISGYDRAPGDFYRVRWKDVLEGLTE